MGASSKRSSNEWVYMAPSPIHGRGLFARRDIPAGTDMVEYAGPRLELGQARRLAREGNAYIFELDRRSALDGSVPWNLARHANHGCRPNARSVKVAGRVWLRALRPIAKGEEITYDYGWRPVDDEPQVCACGQEGCSGVFG